MAVEKMKLITVGGQQKNLDKFIINCCLDGRVQAEPAINHISPSMGFIPIIEENPASDQIAIITEMASRFDGELTVLDEFKLDDYEDEYDKEYLENLSKTIHQLNEEKASVLSQIQHTQQAIENFSHFLEMDIPISEIIDCRYIKFRFGHMPKQSVEKLKNFASNPYLMFFPFSYDEEDAWGVYFAPKSKADQIDQIFASMFFERLRLDNSASTPEKTIEELNVVLKNLNAKLEEIDAQSKKIWENEKKSCDLIYTRLIYGSAIHDLRGFAAVLHDNFCFTFWVSIKDAPSIKKSLDITNGIDWELDDAELLDESYKPPTKLKNNRLFKPFEEFIRMYGVPNYKEFDPTTVFGIVYTIIFGIMFADLGQGLVIAIGGFVLGKIKNSDLGKIFTRCGISSMVFGTLFGSFFGFENALDWFFRLFGLSEKPISVMDSPLGVMLMGIYMGVGMIYFFMCLNIYKSIRQKKFGRALFSESGIAGMICYTGGVVFVTQFINKQAHILPTSVCVALMCGGLALLFVKGWLICAIDKEKNETDGVGDYIITNAVELLEYVISYFTNTLSFLRVGIFVMVHAVLMHVVFTLAPQPSENIIGFSIVVVVGNILVAALECLLTYIQVLRLGFYEMFSRFYDGDGIEFKSVHLRHRADDATKKAKKKQKEKVKQIEK